MGTFIIVILCLALAGIIVCRDSDREMNKIIADSVAKNSYSNYTEGTYCEKNDVLFMTLWGNPKEAYGDKLEIYRKENGNYYLVDHKANRILSSPFFFKAKDIGIDNYVYHPEQLVYTGATVGGIHAGGFHKEEAYYTQRATASGNAVVYCTYGDKDTPYFLIGRVSLNPQLVEKAKAISELAPLVKENGDLICMNLEAKGPSKLEKEAYNRLAATDYYKAKSMESYFTNQFQLPLETCKRIAQFLNSCK